MAVLGVILLLITSMIVLTNIEEVWFYVNVSVTTIWYGVNIIVYNIKDIDYSIENLALIY